MSTGKAPSKGTLVFGIILILIGTVFFMERWLGLRWIWSFLATWWPLLFIFWGAYKIYRYFNFASR